MGMDGLLLVRKADGADGSERRKERQFRGDQGQEKALIGDYFAEQMGQPFEMTLCSAFFLDNLLKMVYNVPVSDTGTSLSKKLNLPAKRTFEIRFLPRVSRGKKHFYPHNCAN